MYKPPQNCNRVKSIKNKFEKIEQNKEPPIVRKRQSITSPNSSLKSTPPKQPINSPSKPKQSVTATKTLGTGGTKQTSTYSPLRQVTPSSSPQKQATPLSSPRNKQTTLSKSVSPPLRPIPVSSPTTPKNDLSRQLSDPLKRNIKRTPAFRADRNSDDKEKTLFETKVKQFCSAKSDVQENKSFLHKPSLVKSKSSYEFKSETDIFRKNNIDMSLLYTEPIPKSLRIKNATPPEEEPNPPKNIYNKSTLQLSDKREFLESLKHALNQPHLTDSLKLALKKPLPPGPAPQKPPRTFTHALKEQSLLSLTTDSLKLKKSPSKNPKYMLNKLEMALRTNKLKRKQKIEVSTSGEDSDDSLLFRSKSCRTPEEVNCFSCMNPAFGGGKDPIYAEPVVKREEQRRTNRNSLYYMSTAVVGDDVRKENTQDLDDRDGGNEFQREPSADTSSLSSCTSDLESHSPPSDDAHAKIQYLIDHFDHHKTLPTQSRVDVLKNSLKITLEQTFESDLDLESPLEEKRGMVATMIDRFQQYQKRAPKYQQPRVNKETLFYCCLVIEKVHQWAQIKFKYPPNVDIPKDIEQLCFPENPLAPPLEGGSHAQTYSLLITSETGDRTYGYCRRVLPEGSKFCLPLAYCILSKYKAPRFYKKILEELESRHGMQDRVRDELIGQFYCKKFPKPGESIKIDLGGMEVWGRGDELEGSVDLRSYVEVNKTGNHPRLNPKSSIFVSETDIKEHSLVPSFISYEGNKSELVLTLHPDPRYEDADLKKLHKLSPDILMKIFSSLLLERKVILISGVISTLSSCVDSLLSILYPFTWYHTFIPILPEALWDIVESPTPVICGVLSEEAVEDRCIENAIVVNLDTNSVLLEQGDEMKILSKSMHKVWRQFITMANNAKSLEYVHSVYLADAYLYVFICCLKNYKQFVVDKKFMKDDLVKSAKTKGIRTFLKMFTETCMFHAFMDTVLNNPESLAAFDKKIEMYGSDESRVILDKLIDWHK